MDYQVYAALFSVWGLPHPLFGVKVGHSKCSIRRANNLLVPYSLQDLFVLRFLDRNEAIKTEDYINYKLNKLFASGGSSEAHLMPIENFNRVYKILRSQLGEKVNYQPNAYAVSNEVLFQDGWPRMRELKKNYVA
mgnify:FL=1